MLTGIRMQSFELFRLHGGIYSPALQLKSPHKSPCTRSHKIRLLPRLPDGLSLYLFGDARPRERESSSPSSPSADRRHCPLVTSCGRKFHISIHTEAGRVVLHTTRPVSADGRKPTRCNTSSLSPRAVISDFGGIDDSRGYS